MLSSSRSPVLVVLLVAMVHASAGCATRRYAQDAHGPAVSTPVAYRTEIALGSCLFTPAAAKDDLQAQFVEALAASLISSGINYIGKALEEAAKATEDRAPAFRNVMVDSGSFGPCIQIVRGWFHEFSSAEERAAASKTSQSWTGPIDESKRKALWDRRMRLAAPPDFVFEAELISTRLEPATDESYLTLAPVFAWMGEPVSHRFFRLSKHREVSVFFGFSDAGKKAEAAEGLGAGIVLGRLERGVERRYAPFESDTSQTPNRGPAESQWFQVKIGKSRKPMTLAGLVVEHQDASAFLGFVAEVFGGAKADMKKAAGAAVLPGARGAAEEAEQAAGEGATAKFEDSLAAVRAATIECVADTGDPLVLAAKVRSKIRSFNAAARAANKDPLQEDLVPLRGDRGAVQQGCRALSGAIDAGFAARKYGGLEGAPALESRDSEDRMHLAAQILEPQRRQR